MNVLFQNSKQNSFRVVFVHKATGIVDEKELMICWEETLHKGVVVVIPDYTLSPNTDYNGMAKQIAVNGLKIVANSKVIQMKFYHRTFSRGHLGALAVMNPKYGIDPKSISGIILNDAAGDMKYYLEENPPTAVHNYITTWTSSPVKWQDASLYFLTRTHLLFNLCR
jgi:hypothetical protein